MSRQALSYIIVIEISSTDQDTDQDETAIKKLLDTLGDETLSASELMQRLGRSHKPTFRKNYPRPALERGLIEATLPDKPTSRYQKYRKIGKGKRGHK